MFAPRLRLLAKHIRMDVGRSNIQRQRGVIVYVQLNRSGVGRCKPLTEESLFLMALSYLDKYGVQLVYSNAQLSLT